MLAAAFPGGKDGSEIVQRSAVQFYTEESYVHSESNLVLRDFSGVKAKSSL
jgi:hypothetical protein